MTWPPSIPKPEAVGKWERLMDTAFDSERNLPQFLRAPRQYGNAALAACVEVIERQEGMLRLAYHEQFSRLCPVTAEEWTADLARRYAEQKAAEGGES